MISGTVFSTRDHIYVAGKDFGNYYVMIGDGENVCLSASDAISIPTGVLNIETNPFKNLKIYPNPTPGLFTLEMDNHIMGELIIDIFGKPEHRLSISSSRRRRLISRHRLILADSWLGLI